MQMLSLPEISADVEGFMDVTSMIAIVFTTLTIYWCRSLPFRFLPSRVLLSSLDPPKRIYLNVAQLISKTLCINERFPK